MAGAPRGGAQEGAHARALRERLCKEVLACNFMAVTAAVEAAHSRCVAAPAPIQGVLSALFFKL